MRDIGSNRITGPEAVLTAAVRWWMDQVVPELRSATTAALRGADPSPFLSRVDLDLGRALSSVMPTESVVQSFWDTARKNQAVKHMVEQAVRSWGAPSVSEKMASARSFVERSILSELGSYVKSSGFLERHADEIRRAKRAAKKAG